MTPLKTSFPRQFPSGSFHLAHSFTSLGVVLLTILLWQLWQPGDRAQAAARLTLAAPVGWTGVEGEAFPLPDARVNTAYEFQFQTEGGLAPLKWGLKEGALPPGLRLDEQGALRGTPVQAQATAYAFTVEVADASRPPQQFTLPCLVLVKAAPLRIVTKAPPLRIVTTNVSEQPKTTSDLKSSQPERAKALGEIQTEPELRLEKTPGKQLTQPQADTLMAAIDGAVNSFASPASISEASPATVQSATQTTSTKTTGPDQRSNFEASFYTGLAIDTFAANDLIRYLNPEGSGKILERAVGGVNFDYRLFGDPKNPGRWSKSGQQLWVYGETVHGTRSSDVDCKMSPTTPVCVPFQRLIGDPNQSVQRTLYILRNATSLEAFTGLRWEFATLNGTGDSPARAYFKAQAGFLTVAGNGGDVVDMHHVGLGLLTTKGPFSGSYLEVGYGRSDLFFKNRRRRVKVDGFLSWPLASSKNGLFSAMRPFAQMTVDADLGNGADSIQTYIGLQFDLRKFKNIFIKSTPGSSGTGNSN